MKKILSYLGIILLILVGSVILAILFPQPLFAHTYTYDNVRVYSSEIINQPALNQAIDHANEILQTSELYDSSYQFDLFLAANTPYNSLDDLILGSWSIARAVDNHVIIKQAVDLQAGTVQNGDKQFDIVYVLVHEMIHCLQNNRYGILAFNPLHHPPMWKLEGYPEYMGRRKLLDHETYELRSGIQDFLSRTAGDSNSTQIIQISANESTPYIYYKGRLMMEYLLDVKGLSYDEVLADSINEEKVYQEMIQWSAHLAP